MNILVVGATGALGRDVVLIRGRPSGTVEVIGEGQAGHLEHVVRADLARSVVRCATEGGYVREALAVGS